MNLLVIGGTQFIGRSAVQAALARGDNVAVFHRGEHEPPDMNNVLHIHGDTLKIAEHAGEIRAFNPDAAIDTTQFKTDTTVSVIAALTGVVRRYVLTSSIDVYMAYGRLHATEPGPRQEMPVDESAELRTLPGFGLIDEIDNLYAERAALGQDGLPVTITRLPAVFGPGDYQRRIGYFLDMIKETSAQISLTERDEHFRWSWGYVDNIADGLLRCAGDQRDGHHIYNLGYPEGLSNRDIFELTAKAAGWDGELAITPDEPTNDARDRGQNWIADTSKIRDELGYSERVSLEEAIRLTVAAESVAD